MAWPKGKPIHSKAGRPPGSKNKKTDLFAICSSVGINVFEEMVLSAAQEADEEKRFAKLRDIAPYLYAKKKETTHLSDFSPDELLDAAEAQLEDDGSSSQTSEPS